MSKTKKMKVSPGEKLADQMMVGLPVEMRERLKARLVARVRADYGKGGDKLAAPLWGCSEALTRTLMREVMLGHRIDLLNIILKYRDLTKPEGDTNPFSVLVVTMADLALLDHALRFA